MSNGGPLPQADKCERCGGQRLYEHTYPVADRKVPVCTRCHGELYATNLASSNRGGVPERAGVSDG